MPGKRMKRAFEIMNERNRIYLEKMNAKEAASAEEAKGQEPSESVNPAKPEAMAEPTASGEAVGSGEPAKESEASTAIKPDYEETLSEWASADEREQAIEEARRRAEAFHKENDVQFEKGDLPAIIISAFLVFGPILLILGAIVVVAWVFLH